MPFRFECEDPDCEFVVRVDGRDELVDEVARHAREHHDESVDEERILDGTERV